MRSRSFTFSALALLLISLLGFVLALAYALPSCPRTSFNCDSPSGLALLFSSAGTAFTLPWFITLAFVLAFVLHLRADRSGALGTLGMILYAVFYFYFEYAQQIIQTTNLGFTLFLYALFIAAGAVAWLGMGELVTRANHSGRLPLPSR
jgi:hypothetical protein